MIYIDFGALSRILLVNFGVYWVPSATIMVVKVQKCKGRHILLRFLSKSYQYLAPHDTLATLRPISYHSDEELEKTVHEILAEASRMADMKNCFIEADVRALDGSERYWSLGYS